MSYNPSHETKAILEEAYQVIQGVPYRVSARWVFYRLLQSGTYGTKAGYKHLLGILSRARKEFYGSWRPDTLADDTRAAILTEREGYYALHFRGHGFQSEEEWKKRVKAELNCQLDRWVSQPVYAEVWFEAAAMQQQFIHHANENLPLLAFHGDISIPAKWNAATRLARRYAVCRKPTHIYYYGDMDPKGLTIPDSAWADIELWTRALVSSATADIDEPIQAADVKLAFHRVGINEDQIDVLDIPENPERPGTYQWEGLDDDKAKGLIEESSSLLDLASFAAVEKQERDIRKRFADGLEEG